MAGWVVIIECHRTKTWSRHRLQQWCLVEDGRQKSKMRTETPTDAPALRSCGFMAGHLPRTGHDRDNSYWLNHVVAPTRPDKTTLFKMVQWQIIRATQLTIFEQSKILFWTNEQRYNVCYFARLSLTWWFHIKPSLLQFVLTCIQLFF